MISIPIIKYPHLFNNLQLKLLQMMVFSLKNFKKKILVIIYILNTNLRVCGIQIGMIKA